jgi:hypothetical protein
VSSPFIAPINAQLICFKTLKFTLKYTGPAEILDDFAKQLWVEPLAWGICP